MDDPLEITLTTNPRSHQGERLLEAAQKDSELAIEVLDFLLCMSVGGPCMLCFLNKPGAG